MQLLQADFQQAQELGFATSTPKIGLPEGATNISISYQLADDRWPLYVDGPAIGPAMLYWGVLCVILIAAIVLNILNTKLALEIPVSLLGWLLLGIGLSTVNSYGVVIAAVFFFLVAARKKHLHQPRFTDLQFNSVQVVIILWTVLTTTTILSAIPMGLLSDPDMKVVGNGSYSHFYNFYQDRVGADAFPVAKVFSVSIQSYRIVMLFWSLWLATRIMLWAKWWWQAYSRNGVWVAKTEQDTPTDTEQTKAQAPDK